MIVDILLRAIISIVVIIIGYRLSQHLTINGTNLVFSRVKVNVSYKLLWIFIAGMVSVTTISIIKEIKFRRIGYEDQIFGGSHRRERSLYRLL